MAKSLFFPAGSYVTMGPEAVLQNLVSGPMTIDILMRSADAHTAWQFISLLTCGDGATDGYEITIQTTSDPAADRNGWRHCSTESRFNFLGGQHGEWHYLRGRRTSNQMGTSMNGFDSGLTFHPVGGLVTADPFLLGMRNGGSQHFTGGYIAYVHLWNIDKGEMGGSIPTEPLEVDANTVARWTFDEGEGLTLGDSGPGGYDGSIVNATWSDESPPYWQAEEGGEIALGVRGLGVGAGGAAAAAAMVQAAYVSQDLRPFTLIIPRLVAIVFALRPDVFLLWDEAYANDTDPPDVDPDYIPTQVEYDVLYDWLDDHNMLPAEINAAIGVQVDGRTWRQIAVELFAYLIANPQ